MKDLCIVGAGVIGTLTAWYAKKKHPEWSIVLVDRNLAGSGASHYAANLDLAYGHTAERRSLTIQSRKLFNEIQNQIPELPIESFPFWAVTHRNNANQLSQCFTAPTSPLDQQERANLETTLSDFHFADSDAVLGGTTAYRGVDNSLVPRLVKRMYQWPNFSLLEGTEVTGFSEIDNGIELTTMAGQSIQTHRLVVATGPWLSNGPFNKLLPPQTVRTKKVVAFHLKAPLPQSPGIFYFFDHDTFIMPRREANDWLMSYRCDEWDVRPTTEDIRIRETDFAAARQVLKRIYPALLPSLNSGRVFCDAYPTDSNPIILKTNALKSCVIAGGAGGSGFRLAPGIAFTAVELLT
jgi:glycine/D-amino acid oxidase-like deaminating enzyme